MMIGTRARRPLVASLAALLVICGYPARTVLAQSTQDQNQSQKESIQDKMRILQERIDELNRELQAVKELQQQQNQQVQAVKEQQQQQGQQVVAVTDTAKKV